MKVESASNNEPALADRKAVSRGFAYYLRRDSQLYLLLLIPMAFVLVFKYAPMSGLVLAFKDYKIARGFWGSEWVGFEVFAEIFAKHDFGRAVRNTLLLNTLDLLFSFTMPIVLALLLNEIKSVKFKRINQTLLYLPHFLSWIIIGAIAYQLLSESNGVVNNVIEMMGGTRIPFLQEDTNWLISYLAIGVWQSMGWGTIIYLAAMSGINPELYEAATVDGAGRWRKVWNVTLPSIRATIVTLLIMNLGRVMEGSFERIFALQNKATTEFTTTIPVLVYRWGIESGNFSRATALGLFQSVIGLALVLLADRIAKKLGEDGLL
ncbi:ABC transporter permease subunit [Paenibacillus macerans]|uniref:ABC transporter permease n=1 Tax=Paenibacillus TaxID=44249 RepID=UPI000EC219AB|nr:ABC transporter permease subunit [Paenibacillus macerans]MDU5945890.1 ABC transporter permease subunit [Paenibacillus macerans]MEC0139560.1 ABC transporter permease subunit [Paenibacillus macerans]MEC0332323.1 ABC transporter permease subunit [Paenibacillus macerans]UMV45425.1 ABC transporter permease subunit [Paenibacillus macerans]GBK63946.1 sugar ABC transporter permease [Paenibacillus macerans]